MSQVAVWVAGMRWFSLAAALAGCQANATRDDAPGAAGDAQADAAEAGGAHLPPLPDAAPARVCNGASALCDRAYDAVVHAGTHDTVATLSGRWTAPTQGWSIREQLTRGGIRALDLDVNRFAGTLAVCAGDCEAASRSLVSVLAEVKGFLDGAPDDVLTLVLRTAVAPTELAQAFEGAGLASLAAVQPSTASWPTLAALVDSGKHLVVFVAKASQADAGASSDAASPAPDGAAEDAAPWLLPAAEWLRETEPSVRDDCSVPDAPRGALILLRHYAPGAAPGDPAVAQAHDADRVAERLTRCEDDRGRLPTLVFFDFAEIGDPNGGVQIANGLRPPRAP